MAIFIGAYNQGENRDNALVIASVPAAAESGARVY
jgi:hypothetical protein